METLKFVLEDGDPFLEKKENENVNNRNRKEMYLKISKINGKVNTIFTSPETLRSYFDIVLNERNAGQGAVFRVWLFSCNDSMSLASENGF